jgi:hypothetical protein
MQLASIGVICQNRRNREISSMIVDRPATTITGEMAELPELRRSNR